MQATGIRAKLNDHQKLEWPSQTKILTPTSFPSRYLILRFLLKRLFGKIKHDGVITALKLFKPKRTSMP